MYSFPDLFFVGDCYISKYHYCLMFVGFFCLDLLLPLLRNGNSVEC